MSHTLVDKEKIVRDQGFKAIDVFVKRAEGMVASMVGLSLHRCNRSLTASSLKVFCRRRQMVQSRQVCTAQQKLHSLE